MTCPMGYSSLHQAAHNAPDILGGHLTLSPSTTSNYSSARSEASISLHNIVSKTETQKLTPARRRHDSIRRYSHKANPEDAVPYLTREEFLSPTFHPKHMALIIQESLIIGGGAAAILLQIASPGVAAGVNEHSNFAHRVPDRLRTTMTYVYCMAFGTPAEKRAVVSAVNRVHRQVRGTLSEGPDAGRGYDALDPELQLWVAATLYHTGLEIYERVFGRIEDEELSDAIYREYAIIAISLQVPAHMWPRDRAAFAEYFARRVEECVVTSDARAVARELLYLPSAPVWMRLLMPSVRCVTAELLPSKIREGFGLRRQTRWYQWHLFWLKAVYRPLPLFVRSLPVRFYLWDMRRRLFGNLKIFEKA